MKFSKANLESTPEWVLIAERLDTTKLDLQQEMLEAVVRGDFNVAAMLAGRITQISETLGLPEEMFPREEE